jgi:hypothetical protein
MVAVYAEPWQACPMQKCSSFFFFFQNMMRTDLSVALAPTKHAVFSQQRTQGISR